MVIIELLGPIVNGIGILIGTLFGLFFNRIPERFKETVMSGIGLTVILIGLSMGFASDRIIVILLSLLTGAVIGELFDLDEKLNRLGAFIEVKFKGKREESNIAEGFVTASLIFVIGAMAVVGALDSGLRGDHEILFTKALIDGFVALVLTTTLGIGVIFSAIPVVLYQGSIALFATQIDRFVPEYLLELFIEDMTATGGLLIVAIGLNLLKITQIRVANLLPSLITVGIVLYFYIQVGNWF
ncbi:membrane protein [Alkalibacillus haloalkaliphilus]|uniref:Membrane protein n=1 Tax=Alkalibacillus haloalkaliphilus TaxID=94136 RepID=A0A511W0P7_9BACI|nr:membrane protein [Alkalibacillus haloalkaliphilus]